jgi:hypothetical protein
MNIKDKLTSNNLSDIIIALNMLGVEFEFSKYFNNDIVIKDLESKRLLFNELIKNNIILYFYDSIINNHGEFNSLVINHCLYIENCSETPKERKYVYSLYQS